MDYLKAFYVTLCAATLCVLVTAIEAQVISIQPFTTRVVLTTAGTEYSYTMPTNSTRVRITARGGNVLYAWGTGQIAAGTYSTIPASSGAYCMGNIKMSVAGGKVDTLYMTGSVNGTIAEIEVWK